MDRAIASQTATDRLRKTSACRSRGFGLQSKAATGMTSFAPAHNIKDRGHNSRHHGLPLGRRTPRLCPSNREAGSTSSIRTRMPGPTMTSRPASAYYPMGRGVTLGTWRRSFGFDVRQAGDSMTHEATIQRRARQMRDGPATARIGGRRAAAEDASGRRPRKPPGPAAPVQEAPWQRWSC
jgi:hypothetical protein